MSRTRIFALALAAMVSPHLLAQTPAATPAPISAATEGQQLGAQLLNSAAGVIKSTAPSAVTSRQGNAGGARSDATAGGASFNISEMLPGADSRSLSNAQSLFTSTNPDDLQAQATTARRNAAHLGCRNTRFIPQGTGDGVNVPIDVPVLTIVAYQRNRVTVATPTPSNPNAKRVQITDVATGTYTGPVPSEALAFPTIGQAPRTREFVITQGAIDGPPGIVLKVSSTPFSAARDGSFFTQGTRIDLGATPVASTDFGVFSTGYIPAWPAVTMNGSVLRVVSQLWKIAQTYSPLPSNSYCPVDPPTCPLDGVNFCAPPSLGVQAALQSGAPGKEPAEYKAFDLLQAQANSPLRVSKNDPTVMSIVTGAAPIFKGTHPIFSTDLYTQCTEDPGSNIPTTKVVHTPDIRTCSNFRKTVFAPQGCQVERSTHFSLLAANQTVLTAVYVKNVPLPSPLVGYTVTPVSGSGPITVDMPVVTATGMTFDTVPDTNGVYLKVTVTPISGDPASMVLTNFRLLPLGAGAVTGQFTNFGSPSDNWRGIGSGTATAAAGIKWLVDVYQIIRTGSSSGSDDFIVAPGNDPACASYVKVLADRFCTPPPNQSVTCLESFPGQAVVDNVPFAFDGVGPSAAATAVFPPWGPNSSASDNNTMSGPSMAGLLPLACKKMSGPPLTCDFPTRGNCTINPQGIQECTQIAGLTLAQNFGDPQFQDTCSDTTPPTPALFGNAACKIVGDAKTTCMGDATGLYTGICYAYQVTYDCGTDEIMTLPGNAVPSTACSGPIRCMGTECHNPLGGNAASDFHAVATVGGLLDNIQRNIICVENGDQPLSPDLGQQNCTISIFGGKETYCRQPIGSNLDVASITPDCCNPKGMGTIDPLVYFKAFEILKKVYRTPQVQTALASFASGLRADPATNSIVEGYEKLHGSIEGAITGTTEMFRSAYEAIANGLGFETVTEVATDLAKDLTVNTPAAEGATQSLLLDAADGVLAAAGLGEGVASQALNSLKEIPGFDMLMQAYSIWSWAKLIGNLIWRCNADEQQLYINNKTGLCHMVGTYCRASALVACIEKRQSFCCYKSFLARVISEQIRNSPTMIPRGQGLFGGWGTPTAPFCRGFSPNELATVDWSRVDLSEYTAMLIKAGLLPGTVGPSQPQSPASPTVGNASMERTKQAKAAAASTGPAFKTPAQMYGLELNPYVSILDMNPDKLPAQVHGLPPPKTKAQRRNEELQSYGLMIESGRDQLADTQPTCYYKTRPDLAPWYQSTEPVSNQDVIEDLGGTGAMTTCGPNCIELILGQVGNNYFSDNCSRTFDQIYSINVRRPELIISAQLVAANFDDHLQVQIGGTVVYEGPDNNPRYPNPPYNDANGNPISSFTNSFGPYPQSPPFKCDLGASWHWGEAPCIGNRCAYAGPGPVDLTAKFQTGGVIQTNTRLLVGGGGEGWAKVRIIYGQPSDILTTNASCFTPTGGFIDKGRSTQPLSAP